MNRLKRTTLFRVAVPVLIAIVIGLGVIVLTNSDDEDRADRNGRDRTTTTSSSVTTSTAESALSSAVWPVASSDTRYGDPAAAARGFAVEYLGFESPVVGELRQGDSRSGEIDVRSTATGPATTVLVRQLGADDSWWVIGAGTASIQVNEPVGMARVSSPVTLDGISTAFEATVQVEVREDGNTEPLARGFVMGGANGELGPFHSTLEFSEPSSAFGTIFFFTTSSEDGRILEASVIRVVFA